MRHARQNWNLPEGIKQSDGSSTHQWESIHAALLMDIRDELQALRAILECVNFQRIPWKLDAIAANTKKRKRKTAKGRALRRVA